MSATPRDLAAPGPWQASLERTRLRRGRPQQPAATDAELPIAGHRDLADAEPWELSLGRSRARRRACQMRFVPAGRRARRISLGTIVALLAAPAASLGDSSAARAEMESSSAVALAAAAHERNSALAPAAAAHESSSALALAAAAHESSSAVAPAAAGHESSSAVAPASASHESSSAVAPATAAHESELTIRSPAHRAVPSAAERDRVSRAGATLARPRGRRGGHTGGASTIITHGGSLLARRSAGGQAGFSPFAMCVARLESGINWRIDTGNGYEGAFQWLHSSWISMGGGRFAPRAIEATPAEQVLIFEENVATDPRAWPTTVPACMGLRSAGPRGTPAAFGRSVLGTAEDRASAVRRADTQ